VRRNRKNDRSEVVTSSTVHGMFDGSVSGVTVNKYDFENLARHALNDVREVVGFVESGDDDADADYWEDGIGNDANLPERVLSNVDFNVLYG